MNMITRNVKAAPVTGADVLAVLDQRLRELQDRRDMLTSMILGLEKTTPRIEVPEEPANALLDGEAFVPTRERPPSQLEALLAERSTIDRALEIGRSRHHRLATERAGEIWAAHFEEIAAVEKRRVELAFALQAQNRRREELREKIMMAGGSPFLTTDGYEMLGIGDHAAEVAEAAERLVNAGIMTRAEIRRLSRD
jgi:hypothetical protein